ncbi:MAG: ABC-2 family transporter protein [Candidatus Babeliales bacterium]
MFLSTVAKYIKLSLLMIKINLKAQIEYKISFITQIFSTIFSLTTFAVIWAIFFMRFSDINGWQLTDSMLLLAISSINLGLINFFCEGVFDIAKIISSGELDIYLTYPKSTLWQLVTNKTFAAGLGDIAFGIFLLFFAGSLSAKQIILFTFLTILTSIIFFSFLVIVNSIGFFVKNFEEAADQFFVCFWFYSFTPQKNFHGLFKILTMTIIPGFFIAELPVSIIREFNFYKLLIMFIFTVFIFSLAVCIFKVGLKRYESGNLFQVRQ